jgi:hypothetical protein
MEIDNQLLSVELSFRIRYEVEIVVDVWLRVQWLSLGIVEQDHYKQGQYDDFYL